VRRQTGLTESDRTDPENLYLNPYARLKTIAELAVREYTQARGRGTGV
jgi:hypothetical protein